MLSCRNQNKIARIQFALAGMDAHINHDLSLAIVATCRATKLSKILTESPGSLTCSDGGALPRNAPEEQP